MEKLEPSEYYYESTLDGQLYNNKQEVIESLVDTVGTNLFNLLKSKNNINLSKNGFDLLVDKKNLLDLCNTMIEVLNTPDNLIYKYKFISKK